MALTWEGYSGPPKPNLELNMYIVLKPTIAGGQRRNAGDIIELSELSVDEAAALIAAKRVEVAPEKPKSEPVNADRSVALEESDAPAPKKRTYTRKTKASK